MSKFSVKISDIQKEHKPKYYVSTWDMSSIRAKEKYRLYKNDVHNLRKFETIWIQSQKGQNRDVRIREST